MAKFVAKRFVYMIITLFLVFTATFFLLASIPGNALTMKIHKLPAQAQERILQNTDTINPQESGICSL